MRSSCQPRPASAEFPEKHGAGRGSVYIWRCAMIPMKCEFFDCSGRVAHRACGNPLARGTFKSGCSSSLSSSSSSSSFFLPVFPR